MKQLVLRLLLHLVGVDVHMGVCAAVLVRDDVVVVVAVIEALEEAPVDSVAELLGVAVPLGEGCESVHVKNGALPEYSGE